MDNKPGGVTDDILATLCRRARAAGFAEGRAGGACAPPEWLSKPGRDAWEVGWGEGFAVAMGEDG